LLVEQFLSLFLHGQDEQDEILSQHASKAPLPSDLLSEFRRLEFTKNMR
jgi:hypothetical protein